MDWTAQQVLISIRVNRRKIKLKHIGEKHPCLGHDSGHRGHFSFYNQLMKRGCGVDKITS